MEKSFKERAIEWLSPFGYSIHSHNPDWTNISFINFEKIGENYPSITCSNHRGNETCIVDDFSLRLFLRITTGELQFLHKNIETYINTIKYYADLCQQNPPIL